MALFRNVRGPMFNNTTQITAVQRYIRNSGDLKVENRHPFRDAAMSIRGAEKMYARENPGIKDQWFESKLQYRTVGHDAMLQARESERHNENNPLLRSVETKPVRFSKRDVNLVERESMEMDEDVKNVKVERTMPLAESSELNLGNTLPNNASSSVKEFKVPKNWSHLEMVKDEKVPQVQQMAKAGAPGSKTRKRKSATPAPNQTAPPLGKKAREEVNPETLLRRVKAKLHPRQSA